MAGARDILLFMARLVLALFTGRDDRQREESPRHAEDDEEIDDRHSGTFAEVELDQGLQRPTSWDRNVVDTPGPPMGYCIGFRVDDETVHEPQRRGDHQHVAEASVVEYGGMPPSCLRRRQESDPVVIVRDGLQSAKLPAE